jgi:membrane protein DedA with SNARE-associated domain
VDFDIDGVKVDQFTLPAFLSGLLSVVGVLGLVLFFRYATTPQRAQHSVSGLACVVDRKCGVAIALVGLGCRKLPRQPEEQQEEQKFVSPVEKQQSRWGMMVLLVAFFVVTQV